MNKILGFYLYPTIRWVMIGFAFLATVLNYIHRLSFNYLSADGELRKLIPDDGFWTTAGLFHAFAVTPLQSQMTTR